MKLNLWTRTLAAAGIVNLASVLSAEEAQQHAVLGALSSTTLSGYVDTSAIWKFGSGNANLPGRTFDGPGKQDGFNLNVVQLTLEKPLAEGQWSAGYRMDLLMGPDVAAISAVGGSAVVFRQAYVDVRAPVGNGLDFKLGVWDSLVGYESNDATENEHYSNSYGYYLQPFQHTGLLASYEVAEWLELSAGVANTINSEINERPLRALGIPATESEKTYTAAISFTAPESFGGLKGATLDLAIVDGLNGASFVGGAPVSDSTLWTIGGKVPTPLKGLTAGVGYTYSGTQEKGTASPSSYANSTAFYLSYKATEKLKLNNRAEYASGSGGTWGTNLPAEEFFGETFTVDYSLWANVISRVEFRWDRSLKGGPGTFGATLPNGDARDHNALSLALNLIYKF